MSTAIARLGLLTITDGSDVSNIIPGHGGVEDAYIVGLAGKTSQQSKTFTLQVTYDTVPDGTNGAWYTLQDGVTLADLPVPAVNKSTSYPQLAACTGFRMKSSAAASGADISWEVLKQFYAFGKLR